MKILHVISSGGMYGAEAVILNLSHALEAAGHTSILGAIATSPHQPPALHTAALAQGIASHLIPCSGQLDLSVPATIRTLAQQSQADVVHAHGYKADIYGWFGLRRTSIPLVSTCHTWYDNDAVVRLYGALDRRVLRYFAGVVAVSEDVERRLLEAGVSPAKVSLIRNGIDLQPFAHAHSTPSPDSPITHPLRVGLVGRLSPEKGVDLFLRAAARVLASHPATSFVVVGDGPDRQQLAALIDELGISANVSMPGHCDDMPTLYASLDLLVSSSRHEGLPIALLEGMASALPLVATRVGAVPSAVVDGVTGLLIPPEDVDALTTAILSLLNDPQRSSAFGAAARSRIEQEFSAQHMANDYLNLYQAVTLKHSRTHTRELNKLPTSRLPQGPL